MKAPLRGWEAPNSLMQDIRPGISISAISSSLTTEFGQGHVSDLVVAFDSADIIS